MMRYATILRASALLIALILWAQPAAGQLPGASPATLGTANNYTALARGFAAIGLNPAGLGMPGAEGFTLAIFPLTFSQSLGPLSFGEVFDYEGVAVPTAVKEDWLQQIEAAGSQTGQGAFSLTEFAFTWKNFGLQLSTIGSTTPNLNDGAAELLLFGNAGRTGQPVDFSLDGSNLTGYAVTTLGISAGFPLSRRWVPGLEQGLSFGGTLKQSWGHTLAFAEDAGSLAQSDPLEVDVDFPMIQPAGEWWDWSRGSGLGLDLGVAWKKGPWSASGVVQNIFNTFEWDLAEFNYRPGTATFNSETNESDFEEQSAIDAPEAVRAKIRELKFKPVIGVAGAYELQEDLTVTAELRQRIGDGLDTGPKSHLGVGVEYWASQMFPVRAGAAVITEGFQVGGGFSLILGPVYIGAAALYRYEETADGFAGSLGLSFGGG